MDPRLTGTPPIAPPPPPPPPPPPREAAAQPEGRGLLGVLGDVVEAVARAIDPPTGQALPESPLGRAAGTGELNTRLLEALGAEPGAVPAPAAARAGLAAKVPSAAQQAADRALQQAQREFRIADTANQWQAGRTDVVSGTQANRQITAGYVGLDKAFAQYAGNAVQPPLANWLAFGKYASNEAGMQIRALEHVLGRIPLSANGKPAVLGMGDLDQALHETFGPRAPAMVEEMWAQFKAKEGGALGIAAGVLDPTGSVAARFAAFAVDTLTEMRNTLVAGNTGIYGDIFPAYQVFLAAENAGGDGVKELERLGFGANPPKNPNNFVIDGFREYQAVRQLEGQLTTLDVQLASLPAGPERTALQGRRDALNAQRTEAMFKANTLIGFKEQMDVLERDGIFENNARFQGIIQAMGGKMALNLMNGETYPLLPGRPGADWTDFATRMGLEELKEAPDPKRTDVIAVTTPQGRKTWFELPGARLSAPTGTIAHMFQWFNSGQNARRLHEGSPPPPRAFGAADVVGPSR